MGSTQRLGNESVVEAKNANLLPRSLSIEPPTPDFNRENLELVDKLLSSPIDSNGSLTPKDCVFDPFAPGPDKFMLAPLRRKYTEESRPSAVRQLSFPLAINLVNEISHKPGLDMDMDMDTDMDESDLFESLYRNILDAIVLEQSKECVDGVLAEGLDSDSDGDGFKTPKCAPRLSWIAETCPGAPLRPSRKCRIIDKELCRKLEY